MLNCDASLSTRNAATLRMQSPDTAHADCKLRQNVASKTWDTVALQGQSVEPLPAGKGKHADLYAAFHKRAACTTGFQGVILDGVAFQPALNEGLVLGSGFYKADGSDAEPTDGSINLWWLDRMHPSKQDSRLSALTSFGCITGHDPRGLGAGEQAAFDLGSSGAAATMLQLVAAEQPGFAAALPALHAPIDGPGCERVRGC